MNTQPAVAIGHNNPPDTADAMLADLGERNAEITKRRDELLAAVDRAPQTVEAEDICGRMSDFVKQITAHIKKAEAKRVDEKEPHLQAGRLVDGFFKGVTDPLANAKRAIEDRITVYQRKKAEEERHAREEAARLAQVEAERKAREAAEQAAALKSEDDLPGAIAAEEAARQAEAEAHAQQQAAQAKAADLSRTRGEYGAVASLRTEWVFADLDREKLDLEALRQHLPSAALETAVRAFIKAGGRELRGVHIFEETRTVVR